MTNPLRNGYDATRDPRTGRPVFTLDAENSRKADAESEPLTEEDNQGIAIGDEDISEDIPGIGEADDLPTPLRAEDVASRTLSSVELNSTAPRMNAPDPDNEQVAVEDGIMDDREQAPERVEGERPEALAKFAEVARNDDGQPVRNGVEATSETAPIPTDLAQKQDAATKVLREGVLKQDQGADQAIDKLPDRTAPRTANPQRQ